MTVLLVSADFDPHIPLIEAELDRRGVRRAFLNMNHVYRNGLSLALDRRPAIRGAVRTAGGTVPIDSIGAVWAPSPWPMAHHPRLDRRGELIVMSEWLSGLRNLYYLTQRRFWVNPLDAELPVSARLYQMHVAQQLGLEIPPTLATTDRREFAEFVARFPNGAAGKRLGELVFLRTEPKRRGPRRQVLFTRHLTRSELTAEQLRAVSLCPCHLEEYVEKATELRVYLVGDRLYAAEILSQSDPETAVDWRKYPERTMPDGTKEIDRVRWRCRPTELSASLRSKLLKLGSRLRLRYSAMDLIKTPDGRIVFLEANYGGVYAWIEEFTGLRISAGIADMLAQHDRAVAA